jgi:hypothetical protein
MVFATHPNEVMFMLLDKVDQFYERIGLGILYEDTTKALGHELSERGFQLGWISVR